MDGTVPEPVVWPVDDFAPAFRAGAFDVDRRSTGPGYVPREDPDRGAPWSEISWRSRLSLLGSIATAPKLLYALEKLEVYSNGVRAEYAVTHGSGRREFYAAARLHVPVRNARLWDATGEARPVPRPKERINSPHPQELIALEPWQAVRYRVKISHPVDKPLEPFGLVADGPARPAALEYFIAAWPPAHTRRSEGDESEVQVFAFGYGRVSVTWSNKPYPADWPVLTRLAGPGPGKQTSSNATAVASPVGLARLMRDPKPTTPRLGPPARPSSTPCRR